MIQFFILKQFSNSTQANKVVICRKIQRGYLADRCECNNFHLLQVQLTLYFVVNVTIKVARSCCRPIVPRLTELSYLINTFQEINLFNLHTT